MLPEEMLEPRSGGRLPVELTSFIGRVRELEVTRDLFLDSRCLTLTGVGGSGKTRLAVELASHLEHEFRAGAVFVDLAPVAQQEGVPNAVAEAIGLVEGGRREPEQALVIALQDSHLLLVLDNCEHRVEACARLVERLLKDCADLRVLITSRQPLDFPGEVSFAVPPLSTPESDVRLPSTEIMAFEAVRLFADRAASVRPGFEVDASNAETIAAICRRLDGLPLAIELAAARARSLSPDELRQRLEQSFSLLSRGPRTAHPRHQALRATIDWSYALLAEPERILFGRLAVFNGGWTLDAVQLVCTASPLDEDIFDVHDGLVAKSLVAAHVSQVRTRYRLLETIRQYATDRLIESGELEAMRERHLACFLERAESYDKDRTLNGSDAGLPTLAGERDNFRAALSWGIEAKPKEALRLTVALDDFWHMVNPAEGWQWLQRTLQRVGDDDHYRARALLVAGKLAGYVRAYAEGTGLLREAQASADASGDSLLAAASELWLGRLAIFAEDPVSAERHLQHALTSMEALGNALGRVRALALLGLLEAVILERRDEGERKLSAAADLARGIGDSWGDGYAHMMLSICAADAEDSPRAQQLAAHALETPSIAPLHAVPVQQVARINVEHDPSRCLRLLGAASALLERFGTEEPAFLARRAETARQRAEQLVGAVTAQRLIEEGRLLGPAEVHEVVTGDASERQRRRLRGLTQRELQVAALVGRFQSNREIARTLFISVRTAESHIEHILAKLTLANRQELAVWTRANGIITDEPAQIP